MENHYQNKNQLKEQVRYDLLRDIYANFDSFYKLLYEARKVPIRE